MIKKSNFLKKLIIICILVCVLFAMQLDFCFAAEKVDTVKQATLKSVEAVDDEYIQIKWSKVSNADGYQIYRATSKKGTYKRIATVKSSKRTYNDKSAKVGKRYYYKVRAFVKSNGEKRYGKFSSKKSGKIVEVIAAFDENNDIRFSGKIVAGTYTLKYKNVNESYTEVCTVKVDSDPQKGVTTLIPQNVMPEGMNDFALFDSKENKICKVSLENLAMTDLGKKLYSFGAISDIHLTYGTAESDFQKALTFFSEIESVDFVTICGDLTASGTDSIMAMYKNLIDTYAMDMPIYEIAGNHESYNAHEMLNSEETVIRLMKTYTCKPLYYSFIRGDDVFIMVGICNDYADFGAGGLQWLYETLEANRNKRCFVFQHIRPDDSCGNAFGIYKNDIWEGVQSLAFENLLKHYRNVIFFHGHSHMELGLQTKINKANYDNEYGMHSIHIPSLAVPRTGNKDGTGRTELYDKSEGYVVDVYESYIVVRGRDFISEDYIPLGTYLLNTELVEIKAKTFIDSTGLIDVN